MFDIKDLAKELALKLNVDNLSTIEEYLQIAYDSNANIVGAIEKARARAKEKNWDYTYWFFDVHEVIIKPNYEPGKIPTEFYPDAKETLQMISKRKDIKMHMFTCSWPHEIEQYDKLFRENDIFFDFTNNKNPEVTNNALGHYENKPYFNVCCEDKSGFLPSHWKYIKKYLEENPE